MEPRDVLLKAADLLEEQPLQHCISTACRMAAGNDWRLTGRALRLVLPDLVFGDHHRAPVYDWYDAPIPAGLTDDAHYAATEARAHEVAAMMREAAQAVTA